MSRRTNNRETNRHVHIYMKYIIEFFIETSGTMEIFDIDVERDAQVNELLSVNDA